MSRVVAVLQQYGMYVSGVSRVRDQALLPLCCSAGDRITVIDDSNEEWWRVSIS